MAMREEIIEEIPLRLMKERKYDVKIEDTGRDGDGITRIEGFVVFVSGAKVGDEVKIRINSARRNLHLQK